MVHQIRSFGPFIGCVRRNALIILVLGAGLGMAPVSRGVASKGPALEPLNRFPRMVQEYFVDQVRQAEARGDRARGAIRHAFGRGPVPACELAAVRYG